MWGGRLYFLLILLAIIAPIVSAFLCSLSSQDHRTQRTHYYSAASNEDDDDEASLFEDTLFLERFKRRRDEAASKIEAERLLRPPSSAMDCKEVVESILNGLREPHEPINYFGYEILYSSSTQHWKHVLRESVGAPVGTKEELIYRALCKAMENSNTQFGLVAYPDEDDGQYTMDFPFDTLDYFDGTSWLECRLRDKDTDTLLVVLGWSFKQRESDGAWLIDGIDWQDFREKFRPGYGREEWERICG